MWNKYPVLLICVKVLLFAAFTVRQIYDAR